VKLDGENACLAPFFTNLLKAASGNARFGASARMHQCLRQVAL